MIISFYDNNFKGLQDNASLVVDNSSYSLTKRGIELDELSCTCEAFIESIQPTFVIVKNNKGGYVYGALAGIPQITEKNQTKITATDLKTMFKSDIILSGSSYTNVTEFLKAVFAIWKEQVLQDSFNVELEILDGAESVAFDNMIPESEGVASYDCWEDIFAVYLKYYGLYMTSRIDLTAKKIVFSIGKSMRFPKNVKLWEYGVYNYGKWVADTNEVQGYILNTDTNTLKAGERWILRSDNSITNDTTLRDIYPIKRKTVIVEYTSEDDEAVKLTEANTEALKTLTESMFNEDLELENIEADFETAFAIYPRRGAGLYKVLPVGELNYDINGLTSVQIGYRFTGIQFLLRK